MVAYNDCYVCGSSMCQERFSAACASVSSVMYKYVYGEK